MSASSIAYLPFMVLPLYARLSKLDAALVEAAADLGAPPWRAFLTVTLPLSLPGVWAGVAAGVHPGVGEYVIPELLAARARRRLAGCCGASSSSTATGRPPRRWPAFCCSCCWCRWRFGSGGRGDPLPTLLPQRSGEGGDLRPRQFLPACLSAATPSCTSRSPYWSPSASTTPAC